MKHNIFSKEWFTSIHPLISCGFTLEEIHLSLNEYLYGELTVLLLNTIWIDEANEDE